MEDYFMYSCGLPRILAWELQHIPTLKQVTRAVLTLPIPTWRLPGVILAETAS